MINAQTVEKIKEKLADKFDINWRTGNITLKKEIAEQLKIQQFEMVFVQGGKSILGNKLASDNPEHEVELSSYFIAKFPVTQILYKAVTGKNPSEFKGENRPVEQVNWYDSVKFCQRLNKILQLPQPITRNNDDAKLDLTSTGFRLPTETEWEYAARGDRQYHYAGSDNEYQVAWFKNNSNETKPVGLKLPNNLGIYDMSGNIFEWCWDWYDIVFYKKIGMKNPVNLSKSSNRVMRGGSWHFKADLCHVAYRHINKPAYKWNFHGFRLVFAF